MKDEVKIILDICDKILLKNVDHHLRLSLEPNSTQFKTLKAVSYTHLTLPTTIEV